MKFKFILCFGLVLGLCNEAYASIRKIEDYNEGASVGKVFNLPGRSGSTQTYSCSDLGNGWGTTMNANYECATKVYRGITCYKCNRPCNSIFYPYTSANCSGQVKKGASCTASNGTKRYESCICNFTPSFSCNNQKGCTCTGANQTGVGDACKIDGVSYYASCACPAGWTSCLNMLPGVDQCTDSDNKTYYNTVDWKACSNTDNLPTGKKCTAINTSSKTLYDVYGYSTCINSSATGAKKCKVGSETFYSACRTCDSSYKYQCPDGDGIDGCTGTDGVTKFKYCKKNSCSEGMVVFKSGSNFGCFEDNAAPSGFSAKGVVYDAANNLAVGFKTSKAWMTGFDGYENKTINNPWDVRTQPTSNNIDTAYATCTDCISTDQEYYYAQQTLTGAVPTNSSNNNNNGDPINHIIGEIRMVPSEQQNEIIVAPVSNFDQPAGDDQPNLDNTSLWDEFKNFITNGLIKSAHAEQTHASSVDPSTECSYTWDECSYCTNRDACQGTSLNNSGCPRIGYCTFGVCGSGNCDNGNGCECQDGTLVLNGGGGGGNNSNNGTIIPPNNNGVNVTNNNNNNNNTGSCIGILCSQLTDYPSDADSCYNKGYTHADKTSCCSSGSWAYRYRCYSVLQCHEVATDCSESTPVQIDRTTGPTWRRTNTVKQCRRTNWQQKTYTNEIDECTSYFDAIASGITISNSKYYDYIDTIDYGSESTCKSRRTSMGEFYTQYYCLKGFLIKNVPHKPNAKGDGSDYTNTLNGFKKVAFSGVPTYLMLPQNDVTATVNGSSSGSSSSSSSETSSGSSSGSSNVVNLNQYMSIYTGVMSGSTPAATYCAGQEDGANGTKQFLPSIKELRKIYNQKDKLNTTLYGIGKRDLDGHKVNEDDSGPDQLWSSIQACDFNADGDAVCNKAYYFDMGSGSYNTAKRSKSKGVRCVFKYK